MSSPDPNASDAVDIRALFHRLNNQLSVILAHAELLEAKASDAGHRERAALVVSATLEAIGLAKAISEHLP